MEQVKLLVSTYTKLVEDILKLEIKRNDLQSEFIHLKEYCDNEIEELQTPKENKIGFQMEGDI